jgi:hypothetical protein
MCHCLTTEYMTTNLSLSFIEYQIQTRCISFAYRNSSSSFPCSAWIIVYFVICVFTLLKNTTLLMWENQRNYGSINLFCQLIEFLSRHHYDLSMLLLLLFLAQPTYLMLPCLDYIFFALISVFTRLEMFTLAMSNFQKANTHCICT